MLLSSGFRRTGFSKSPASAGLYCSKAHVSQGLILGGSKPQNLGFPKTQIPGGPDLEKAVVLTETYIIKSGKVLANCMLVVHPVAEMLTNRMIFLHSTE